MKTYHTKCDVIIYPIDVKVLER